MIKLLKYLKPYTGMIIATSIILLFQVVGNLFVPNLLADMVKQINPQASAAIINIVKTGAIALSVVLGVVVCQIVTAYFASKISMGMGRDIRSAVFKKTQKLALNEFNMVGTSSLINRTTNDITQIQTVMLMMFRVMLTAPIMLIGGCFMAFSLDLTLPFIILGTVPVLLIFMVFIGVKVMPLFKVMQEKVDNLTRVTRENLTGVRVIRAFNNDPKENVRFEKANKDAYKVAAKANTYMAFAMPAVELIFSVGTIVLIYFGARWNTNYADLLALVQYASRIMMAFLMMIMMFVFIPRASASAKRINEILNLPETIRNPEVVTEQTKATKKKEKSIVGKLEFKNVSFIFPNAEEPTIKNLSFTANPNEVVAIIGSTGSGKSTVVNLIPRFYDITEGEILLDNKNINSYKVDDLRKRVALASQSVELFNLSIKDNLKYGNEHATDDEIIKAAQISQSLEFINSKPEGFDFMVARGGSNLSGGQKQRLNIARALVKKPEVYIFDDSFSALDFKTDSLVRKALRENVKDATMIIVAQRVSTIRDADKIIVLNNGVAVGIGTHEELLKTCKEYQEIVDSQTKKKHVGGNKNGK